MAQQCGLQLISKLRSDAALYAPYAGPYQGHGPRRKYGAKLNYAALPHRYLKATTVEGAIETRTYQAEVLHKAFGQALNVVIIEKVNRTTQKRGQVILFSSDRTLAYDKLVEYYGLRFQIEIVSVDPKLCHERSEETISSMARPNLAEVSVLANNPRRASHDQSYPKTH
jgi:hypothetical protein